MNKHKLSDSHWTLEHFAERMTAAQWKRHLLKGDDKIVFRGTCRQLVGKSLGCGVVEVSKMMLPERIKT